MRIHTDTLTSTDLYSAAMIARVDLDLTINGSRSRERAFNVTLTGESKRRPNSGQRGAGDDYAATWDQWGIFLAVLFYVDPSMVTPYYADANVFDQRTAGRFRSRDVERVTGDPAAVQNRNFWPLDAHGDHRFTYQGVPREQSCTKCSAVQRWAV